MDDNDLDFEKITELLKSSSAEAGENRRKGPDVISRLSTLLMLSAWVLNFAVWIVQWMAQARSEYNFITSFFATNFGTSRDIATHMDYTMLYSAYILQLVALGACVISFLFHRMRMRRKTDKTKISILVISGITVTAFVTFLMRYGQGFLWY